MTSTPHNLPPADPSVSLIDLERLRTQNERILERLKAGRATSQELAAIAVNFGRRISDLRKAGHQITCTRDPRHPSIFWYRLAQSHTQSRPVFLDIGGDSVSDRTQHLVDWFRSNRERMPAAPFVLSTGLRVVDLNSFLAAIDRDIAAGPNGPRWLSGALRVELERLQVAARVDRNRTDDANCPTCPGGMQTETEALGSFPNRE